MLTTIIVFFVILGILVLVHELGHFITAKRNGVVSEEFGFGFPPRIVGTYKDKNGKRRWVFGNKEIEEEIKHREETIYSINLIPLGGFVKIKGEDGNSRKDPDSFASQSIWVRFKILFAGVAMNFILAILLFAFAFWLGLPEVIEDDEIRPDSKVQIANVLPNGPAAEGGIQMGDEVVMLIAQDQEIPVTKAQDIQDAVEQSKGKELKFKVIHPGESEAVLLSVKVREEAPAGQGLTGIEIVKTALVEYGPLESLWLGVKTSFKIIGMIFAFLGDLLVRLVSQKPVEAEVAGPVGIAVMTGQVSKMGLAFVLQFTAMLSVNLAVINILPLPALDGGRILFLIIEKIKGRPINEKLEGWVHAAGFIALLGLMVLVTARDFVNFEIVETVKGWF